MFSFIKENISQITTQKPGERFRYYHRLRKEKRPSLKGLMFLVSGVVCIAIGIPLMVLPGPAIVFFMIGLGLIASQLYVLALTLDKTEVYLRKILPPKRVEEMLRFIIVGVGVLIANFILYYVLIEIVSPFWANTLSLLCVFTVGFYICKHWIFSKHKDSYHEIWRFAVTCALAGMIDILVNQSILYFFPQIHLIAFFLAAAVAGVTLYFLAKFWVFKQLR